MAVGLAQIPACINRASRSARVSFRVFVRSVTGGTSKVAWHASGRLLAFAVPRTRSTGDQAAETEEMIFLYDRDRRRVSAVPGSQVASPLAFPDFIGDDALVYLVPGRSRGERSVFRVVSDYR